MVLIDSVYINDGGGLVLLKFIIEIIEETGLDVFYLMDERTQSSFNELKKSQSKFIANSIFERKLFYKKNIDKFSKIFCFGNIPPPIKLDVPVYVYFHQKLFVEIPRDFNIKQKFIYTVKQFVLNFYKKNASLWLVQTQLMQQSLADKYFTGNISNIKTLPFYPPLAFNESDMERKKSSFLYISNASPHKNHLNLINAFCMAYDKTKKGLLTITVSPTAIDICNLVKEKVEAGYPIKNLGFIERKNLAKVYLSHEYLIFPSLAESFGLGLAEAIDAGCKVVAADLPYTHQVCYASLTFNPYTIEGIEGAIITAINQELPDSNKIIPNDINQLISLLSE